jgi:hypothetical protein
MAMPPLGTGREVGGPDGYSYGAVLIGADGVGTTAVEEALRDIRFSGWIAPSQGGWLVLLSDRGAGAGVVASDQRGVIEVGGLLAKRVDAPLFAVQIRRDRQLAIVAWRAGDEVGRYCSDPSQDPGADDEVLSAPVGAGCAFAFADLAGRTEVVDDLVETLEDELDPDSVYESERLRQVLRLLGLPDWIVAANALPRDIPTGPRARELTHLRAGVAGARGILRDVFIRSLRRRRMPPPVIADPPRSAGMSGLEPWMF